MEEIRRRTAPPESMSVNTLTALLRTDTNFKAAAAGGRGDSGHRHPSHFTVLKAVGGYSSIPHTILVTALFT